MKNRFALLSLIALCAGLNAQTSTGTSESSASSIDISDPAAMLILSTPDYLVTPGDIYRLTYAAGGAGGATPVQYVIPVDSSYRIRVSNLGVVNAKGKTFLQLKSEVESIVSRNYPLSGVQLVMTQAAAFNVYVRGEVSEAKEVTVTGLTRLSQIARTGEGAGAETSVLTRLSSQRDVEVKNSEGQTRTFDLFRAKREGDLSQDPYLRPGDTVTFNRARRVVTVSGAVNRPGTYQLLDGENLKALIDAYCGGLTPLADRTRVELVRQVNSAAPAGDRLFLSDSDFASDFAIEDYDSISVPARASLQPVMFVEGAVGGGEASPSSPTVSARLTLNFNKGDTYGSLVRAHRDWFSSTSDTKSAYIIRGDTQIALNLNPMLYDPEYRGGELIEERDTLVIPFRQYFVTVKGAVVSPGQYPYIPGRNWEYYVTLARGFDPMYNEFSMVSITDIQGNKKKKSDPITPETVITAKRNTTLFIINKYVAPITTALTAVVTAWSAFVAIDNLSNQ